MTGWLPVFILVACLAVVIFANYALYQETEEKRPHPAAVLPSAIIWGLAVVAIFNSYVGISSGTYVPTLIYSGVLLLLSLGLWIVWRRYLMRKHGIDPGLASFKKSLARYREDKKNLAAPLVTMAALVAAVVLGFLAKPGGPVFGDQVGSRFYDGAIAAFLLLTAGITLFAPSQFREHPYRRIGSALLSVMFAGYFIFVGITFGGLFHLVYGLVFLVLVVAFLPKFIRDIRTPS